MSDELSLAIYGVRVLIRGGPQSRQTLSGLREDLGYFESERDSHAAPEILIQLEPRPYPPEQVPVGSPLFSTRMCQVYGWGALRCCDYGEGDWVCAENGPKERRFTVYSTDPERMYELAYLALLSSAGESLDRRGLHRVHALGVEASGRAGLLLLPSGGGKSSIAALLAQDPAVKIFSDESPLVDRQGRLHPFPVRLALLPEVARALELNPEARLFRRKIYAAKQLFPIARSQTAASAPVSFVLIGVPGISPSVASVSKWRIFRALFLNAVVGLGLAQMSEHFLRLPGA
ncbi:MAG: hypothetical protein ACXWPM_12525, partial [Bdellovibrionota bacterium]